MAPNAAAFSLEEQPSELERAEAELWAWYLERSQVARTAIKQRSLLRQLGFRTGGEPVDARAGARARRWNQPGRT